MLQTFHSLRPSLRIGLLLALLLPACGDGDSSRREVLAGDIAIAHTPPGGYGEMMPAPILAACTEPLVAGAPDLRGTWTVVAAERGGRPVEPNDPIFEHVQRIEQCGDRLVVTGGGVVHDMRCDGTVENGVHDVAAADFTTPITVVATYEDGVHVLRPVGIGVEITRRREADEMIWNYLNMVVRLRSDDYVDHDNSRAPESQGSQSSS
ncbi:MAG TPA: hypothetical protein VEB21_17780 [Terriglobales bacterium]|nr:hypothetical protein [Terriglobales bacterium]